MTDTLGSIETAGSNDTFNFTLTRGRQYIIDVTPNYGSFTRLTDPILRVFDQNDINIKTSPPSYYDDEGPQLAPELVITPTETQNYRFVVSGFGSLVGNYVISVWRDDFRNYGDGIAPAGALLTGGRVSGRVNYDDDAGIRADSDVHEVTLIENLTYVFDLRGSDSDAGTLDDPSLSLYDYRFYPEGSPAVLTDTRDGGTGLDDRITYTAGRTQTYYLEATGIDGTGTYRISASIGKGTEDGDDIVGSDFADAINVLGGDDSVAGGKGKDRIFGGADIDRLRGGEDADKLYGGDGRDRLYGDAGADRLTGGKGRDALDGGADADVYNYDALGESGPAASDTIVSFTGAGRRGGDRIHLGDIDANAERAGDQAFRFGSAEGIGRLWAEDSGNDTEILGNVDSDAAPEIRIIIDDGRVLARAYDDVDFIL